MENEVCSNTVCNQPAVKAIVREAPFTMTSSSSNSTRIELRCQSCADHDERMQLMLGEQGGYAPLL